MHPLARRLVTKMNGIGNEIVLLDLRDSPYELDARSVRAIAQAPDLAFDQLMVLHAPVSAGTEAYVRIYNRDGSEAGACGNGTRCVAWTLMQDTPHETLRVETLNGILVCERKGERRFSVEMGRPRFGWQDIPLSGPVPDTAAIPFPIGPGGTPLLAAAVNVGNPHAVFLVDDLDAYDLSVLGPALEHDAIFPERANISFAQVRERNHIVVRVWERGAGLTYACGSAACAVLVAAVRRGLAERNAVISLPGGDLHVTWRQSDDQVVLAGPVELEFKAILESRWFEDAAA
ncbi:diaminopimelate epimerase [Methylovirgula ligni]|uniref:Diaminopimelate epimerase n=1 Tax=Methylovirgula ligni TaxID=569860 RepID=A0A3D9YQ49_9HYPH|nr:diaminopimelate epimerase [Methylovirgula ligni]QAY94830.1 diaminopimelate epimerase [Methylovirgula ligni]REF84746.1 diaminopimelate epimerase [Methylovirgula ligni]